MSAGRAAVLGVGVVVLAALWIMPSALFPNPGANDAIGLSTVGPLVYLATLAGVVVLAFVAAFRRLPVELSTGIGTLLLLAGAAEILGLVSFGNLSNDRYAPLMLAPLPTVLAGVVVLATSLIGSGRGPALRGVLRGVVAGAAFALWLEARGASAWLRAPYGLDVMLLLPLGCATLAYLALASAGRGGRRTAGS